MKTLSILLYSVLALAIVVACNGNGRAGPTPDQPAETPSPAAGGAEAIDIFDFGYNPATTEISAGTVVTWTNTGNTAHTVTFDDGPDSGDLSPGATFEETFDEVGQHTYICTIHPSMRGVVNVSP